MKSGQFLNLSVFLCLLFGILLSSCEKDHKGSGSSPIEETDDPFSSYRVSCIIPHRDDGSYWSIIVHGLQRGGEEFNIDVKMSYPSLNYDNEQMIDLIRMAISARVDAIVVPGSESTGYREILEKAQSRGIAVVLVDTNMEKFEPELYVGSDNFRAGVLIGEKLSLCSNGKAVIGIISGGIEFYNLQQRLAGLISIIDSYPQMRIKSVEYDRFDYLKIQRTYRQYTQDPDIDTIICLEGTGVMAITPLLDSKPPVRIIAFDDSAEGIEAIESKLINGLVVQEKYHMGYRVLSELNRFRTSGEFSSGNIITDLEYMDACNGK